MADNNTILEKLEGLVARFEEVSTLITDPAVIADQKRYVKLTKEYKELGDLMNARKEYMQVLNGIEEAKEIIANETDAEMREMAREELDACQARQPELEEPEYGCRRGNSHRMYRNARPAEEQRTRPVAPAYLYIRQGAPEIH